MYADFVHDIINILYEWNPHKEHLNNNNNENKKLNTWNYIYLIICLRYSAFQFDLFCWMRNYFSEGIDFSDEMRFNEVKSGAPLT